MSGNLPVKKGKKKWWESFKKFKSLYFLEIVLFIPIVIIGLISYFLGPVPIQIYLYIALFYFASWWMTSVITELILLLLKGKSFPKFKQKYPKTPKVFEYAFFLGLFWATAILTDAYSRPHNSGIDFFNFLNNFGVATFFYGFASACGWYHYIERLDD